LGGESPYWGAPGGRIMNNNGGKRENQKWEEGSKAVGGSFIRPIIPGQNPTKRRQKGEELGG